jgi:hypothetical protein
MAEAEADDSVHLTVTSIPFEELFTYSGKLEDVGNNGSTIDVRAGRFALNLRFVIEQLYRVTAPGCNAASTSSSCWPTRTSTASWAAATSAGR